MQIEEAIKRWEEMEPRERDAWVAENVMGWRWWERAHREPDGQGGSEFVMRKALFPSDDGGIYERVGFFPDCRPASKTTARFSDWDRAALRREADGRRVTFGIPCYSNDPADDYKVLERVRETWAAKDIQEFHRVLMYDLFDPRGGLPIMDPSPVHYRAGDYAMAAFIVLSGKEVGV